MVLIIVWDGESAKTVPDVIRIGMLNDDWVSIRAREPHLETRLGSGRLLTVSDECSSPTLLSLQRVAVEDECRGCVGAADAGGGEGIFDRTIDNLLAGAVDDGPFRV